MPKPVAVAAVHSAFNMLVNKITEAVIYESPDGGKTVYVRKPGQNPRDRQLNWESDEAKELRAAVAEETLWRDIIKTAKSNPTLRQALDEAVMIYNLSK